MIPLDDFLRELPEDERQAIRERTEEMRFKSDGGVFTKSTASDLLSKDKSAYPSVTVWTTEHANELDFDEQFDGEWIDLIVNADHLTLENVKQRLSEHFQRPISDFEIS